jgi:hypothetical protein
MTPEEQRFQEALATAPQELIEEHIRISLLGLPQHEADELIRRACIVHAPGLVELMDEADRAHRDVLQAAADEGQLPPELARVAAVTKNQARVADAPWLSKRRTSRLSKLLAGRWVRCMKAARPLVQARLSSQRSRRAGGIRSHGPPDSGSTASSDSESDPPPGSVSVLLPALPRRSPRRDCGRRCLSIPSPEGPGGAA